MPFEAIVDSAKQTTDIQRSQQLTLSQWLRQAKKNLHGLTINKELKLLDLSTGPKWTSLNREQSIQNFQATPILPRNVCQQFLYLYVYILYQTRT